MEYIYTDKDGNQTKFTDEMIGITINERNELRSILEGKTQTINNLVNKKHQIITEVYDFFASRYNSGDEKITCTKEDINELLESIGSNKLKSLWTISGRIEFTITDVEADSEDDAKDQVENNITVEFDGNMVDDWSLDVNDIDEQ